MARRLQIDQRDPVLIPVNKFGKGTQFSLLEKGVQAHRLRLRASSTFTITTAAGGTVRNKGSIWAALNVKVTHGGDVIVYRGRQLAYLTEFFSPSPRSISATGNNAGTRLSSLSDGMSLTLQEHATLYFAFPFLAKRRETAFMERNPSADTKIEIYTNSANPEKDVVTGGTGAALGDITVDVIEDFDAVEGKKPLYQPYVRQMNVDVTGSVNEKAIPIQLADDETLLGVLIEEEAGTVGEVSDILTSFRLRDGQFYLFGARGAINKKQYQQSLEAEWGGKVFDQAYTPIWMPYDAKLSNSYKPRNLEFVFSGQPTVTAGADANSSRLNIALLIGKRDTATHNGRKLVSDAVPFAE